MAANGATMVEATCVCGTRVRMSVAAAGKKVPCMACGAVVQLPATDGAPANAPPPGLASRFAAPPEEQRQRYRAAIEALTERPRNLDLILAAAQAAEAIGYKNEAFVYYERAFTLDPSRGALIERLGENATEPDQKRKVEDWLRRPPSFAHTLDDVFFYPFRGSGFLIVFFGALIVFGVRMMMQFSMAPWAAWVACAVLWGYLCTFWLSVLKTTAIGEDDIPHWPDLTDVGIVIGDLLRISLAYTISFLPLILLGLFVLALMISAISSAAAGEPAPSEGTTLAVVIAMAVYAAFFTFAGLIYLPMALLANAIFNWPFACWNPAFIVRSIWATRGDYTMCALAYLLMGTAITGLEFLARVSWVFFFIAILPSSFITMYSTVVQMRLLGMFFRYNQGRLAWLIERN